MKRIFSFIVATCALQFFAFAQCPNPNITAVGFHPPADQLTPIERGVAYSEDVQINIPASFDTVVFGNTLTVTINTVQIDNLTGTPTGITYTCTPSNCTFNGGQAGCINFSGITNDPAGQYPLDVTVTAQVTIPLLGQQTQTTTLAALGFTYYLTVIEAGALSVTAGASPAGICPGESSTLSAVSTNATGSETYVWSNGAGTGSSVSVSPTSTTTYTVTVTDGGTTAVANTMVTVNPAPTAAISPSIVTICTGASTTVTASGGGTYEWSTGATTVALTVSPTSTTFYTVTVTNNGCTATATDTVEVNPTPAPVADFDTAQTDATVIFTNNSTNATGYSWDFGDGSSGTDPNPTRTYTANGTFTVTLTATNSCGSDTYSEDVTIVGVFIGSVKNDLQFSVYPNPSEGVFTILFSDNSGKSSTVKIYDLSCKNVFEETLSGTVQKQLDLSALPKGIYTLHLNSEKSNGVQKLVIR